MMRTRTAAFERRIREEAMKISSLVVVGLAYAILSIAPANAESLATTTGNCSTTTGVVSPVPCTKPPAQSYVECTERVTKIGAKPSDAWWWCTNQGYKK
jgi:hypothetical protein